MVLKINPMILSFMVGLFFVNFITAHAQSTLNRVDVEKYLETLPLLRVLSEKYEAEKTLQADQQETILEEPSIISRTPITDSLEITKDHSTFPEFIDIIKKAGFSSPQQWANAGDQIMLSYSAYRLKNTVLNTHDGAANITDIKKDMAEKLDVIKKNKFIDKGQQEVLIKKIENFMELINDPNYIDNENITIITPYIDRLNLLFKEFQ